MLFMDVDIVWNKNPLDFFRDETSSFKGFDIIMQDDSNRSVRFAPYFGNSGFFYARHNERTRYFVSVYL